MTYFQCFSDVDGKAGAIPLYGNIGGPTSGRMTYFQCISDVDEKTGAIPL